MRPQALLIALLHLPTEAAAQTPAIGFEGLFKDITDINFFYSCWSTKKGVTLEGRCPSAASGYGVEVSYDLGKIRLPRSGKYDNADEWKDTLRTVNCRGSTCEQTCKEDCVGTIQQYKKAGSKGNPYEFVRVEFALSYSQFSGFASPDTSFDLRGSVREVPGIALYGSLGIDKESKHHSWFTDRFGLYGGIRSGLIQLNNVQILDHNPAPATAYTVYTASGLAFQVGLATGVIFRPAERVNFFYEYASSIRRFANVQWAGKSDNQIPTKFPNVLDFTGKTNSVGVQVTVRTR